MHVWRSLVYFTLVSPYLIFVCRSSSLQERENFHPAVEYDQGQSPNLEGGQDALRPMAPLPLLRLFRRKRALLQDGIRKLASGKLLFPLGGNNRRTASQPKTRTSPRGDGESSGSILNNLCLREGKRRTQSGMGAVGTTSIIADDYGTSNAYAQDAGRNSASSARASALQHGNTGVSYSTTDNKEFHRPGLVNTLLCAVQIETILQPVKGKKQKSKKRRKKKRKTTTTTTTTTPAPAEYEEEESEEESSEESRRRKKRTVQWPSIDDFQVAQYVQNLQRRMRNVESLQLELNSQLF